MWRQGIDLVVTSVLGIMSESVVEHTVGEIAAVEDGLDDAAQGEETQIGYPQAVVAPFGRREPVDDKEQ